MKKLILIALLAFGMLASAQSDYSYEFTTAGDAVGHVWDYSDTLTNGETLDAIIRVKSPTVVDMQLQIVFDELSGTSTGTATFYGSNDGETFIATGDSISSALTADGSIWIKVNDFGYSYAKVLLTTTGTETSCAKLFYSIRKE